MVQTSRCRRRAHPCAGDWRSRRPQSSEQSDDHYGRVRAIVAQKSAGSSKSAASVRSAGTGSDYDNCTNTKGRDSAVSRRDNSEACVRADFNTDVEVDATCESDVVNERDAVTNCDAGTHPGGAIESDVVADSAANGNDDSIGKSDAVTDSGSAAESFARHDADARGRNRPSRSG